MRRTLVSLLLAAAFVVPAAADRHPSRRLIVPGASGFVRTVVEGTEPVEIPLRVLGTFDDVTGPGFDLYLVELEGPLGERTGVAAGMSGSPVYVDGELVGALAYRFGAFPRTPVGGVTPIEDVRRARLAAGATQDGAPQPIGAPLSRGGLRPAARRWLVPELTALGFVPVAGGGGGAGDADAFGPLTAGSPIAAMFVSGDLTIASSGTVTEVDGDTLYAFGHVFLGAGRIDLPLARARVAHTLADDSGSSRLSEFGEVCGALVEDRLTGIVGRLDRRAATTAVRIRIEGEGYRAEPWRFEVLRHRTLGPLFTAVALLNTTGLAVGFEDEATLAGEMRVRTVGGDRLSLPLHLSGSAGAHPSFAAGRRLQQVLALLASHGDPSATAAEVEIDVRLERGERGYRVERVLHDRRPLRAGGTLPLTVLLRKPDGGVERRGLELAVPDDAAVAGSWQLLVGSAGWVESKTGNTVGTRLGGATEPAEIVRALGSWPADDRLVAVLHRRAGGVSRDGRTLQALPPSALMLLADEDPANRAATPSRIGGRGETTLDGPVSGGRSAPVVVAGRATP